jgi:hypothetical protein
MHYGRMLIRRAIPICTLVVLTLLTVGAAVVGVSSSPTVFYASLAPGNPRAAAELHAIVRRTMGATSFTWHLPGLRETLVYNAPNRIHDYMGSVPIQTIGVGTTFYFQASDLTNTESNAWLRIRHRPFGYSSANEYAMKYLTPLLSASSVTRSSTTFVAESVYLNDPFASGQMFERDVIRTDGRDVTSERVEIQGIFPVESTRVETSYLTVTFSKIGTSPLVAPPIARTINRGQPFCGPITSGVSYCPA